jgi:hypothetical protein
MNFRPCLHSGTVAFLSLFGTVTDAAAEVLTTSPIVVVLGLLPVVVVGAYVLGVLIFRGARDYLQRRTRRRAQKKHAGVRS